MRQVLFDIPLDWLHVGWHIPIYGYGLMLFLAYLLCSALARRLCKWQGIDGTLMNDLAIWLFVAGILGGRIVFVIQYWHTFKEWTQIFRIMDGGLVLYGALVGGALGYFAYYHFVLRRHGVSNWKMLDVIAPCLPLGIALGRIGCLCTGCCYGNVACTAFPPPLHFPYQSPAWGKMVQLGYQSPLGFLLKERIAVGVVEEVEPGSAAADAGLRPGDVIEKVNGAPFLRQADLAPPEGERTLTLTVLRGDQEHEITFAPTSIGVNPTQIYETISMCLLLFFLVSYFPYRRHDGELLVLFMACYALHRYLNEMLRTDTDPVAFGLTLSQNVSIAVLAAAAILAYFVWRRPMIGTTPGAPPEAAPAPVTTA